MRLLASTFLLNRLLQLHVGLLLDCLRVLQLLDELHLQKFHLNDFLLLVSDKSLLFFNLALDLHASVVHASAACLFNLLLRNLLLHSNLFFAHMVLLSNVV